ncbi:MAG: alpha/beta hydrolase [Promethearchaeota archaeon]|jgi:acetyl esterase/lipase
MPIVDRSKLRPEIIKFLDVRQEIGLAGTEEFLKLDEAKEFNLQAHLAKLEEYNLKYYQMLSSKKGSLGDFYQVLTDKEIEMLTKFYRFSVNYAHKIEREQHPLPPDIKIEEVDIDGIPAEWQIIPGSNEDRVLIYLHGGGFILNSPKNYRTFTIELARQSNMKILSLDYPLAPEHPYPAALEASVNAYQWVLSKGYEPKNVVIAGDSAGANLTLVTLLKLRDDGVPLPLGAVVISPPTIYTNDHTTKHENAPTDPILGDIGVFWWETEFIAGADVQDPLISPLLADLKDLPPILIQVSTSEMLYDNSTRFAKRAQEAGVDVTLQSWDDTLHVFQLFGIYDLPEAREANDKIGEFIHKLFT